MRNYTDERYADNPAEAEAHESRYHALMRAARQMTVDIGNKPPSPALLAEVMANHMEHLHAIVRADIALQKTKAPEKRQEEPNV